MSSRPRCAGTGKRMTGLMNMDCPGCIDCRPKCGTCDGKRYIPGDPAFGDMLVCADCRPDVRTDTTLCHEKRGAIAKPKSLRERVDGLCGASGCQDGVVDSGGQNPDGSWIEIPCNDPCHAVAAEVGEMEEEKIMLIERLEDVIKAARP